MPHPTAALTAMHAASLPHFLPSPALASPVGSTPPSQPTVSISAAPCSTLFVANLGQFVSEQELKEIFNRYVPNFDSFSLLLFIVLYIYVLLKIPPNTLWLCVRKMHGLLEQKSTLLHSRDLGLRQCCGTVLSIHTVYLLPTYTLHTRRNLVHTTQHIRLGGKTVPNG